MKTELKNVISWYFNINTDFSELELKNALSAYEYFLYDNAKECYISHNKALKFIMKNMHNKFEFTQISIGDSFKTSFADYSIIHIDELLSE